jgi:hypothetical protein
MTSLHWSIITLALLATFFAYSLIAIASRSDRRRRRAMPVRVVELPINIGQATAWRRRSTIHGNNQQRETREP